LSSQLYDPERDRVRMVGRWLRWALPWVLLPAIAGVVVSGNVDVRSLPLFGSERLSAVLFLDGQAYFGHLDDSGESGTLVLRDVYYFKNSSSGPTGLPVGLVRRGTEAHEPADGMRINRDRILAIERVGLTSPVSLAIEAERQITRTSSAPISLNSIAVAGAGLVATQRVAAEHDLQRALTSTAEQLAKLNDLVLPISKTEAAAIQLKALDDLRTVRRSGLTAIGTALGMSAADTEAYVRATDPALEGQTFASDAAVLLAPDLDGIVSRATQLYAQVGDAASKQITQPVATPAPTPSPKPSAKP
jgi:hypothetical protein